MQFSANVNDMIIYIYMSELSPFVDGGIEVV